MSTENPLYIANTDEELVAILSKLHGIPPETARAALGKNGTPVNYEGTPDGKVLIDSPKKSIKERIKSILHR